MRSTGGSQALASARYGEPIETKTSGQGSIVVYQPAPSVLVVVTSGRLNRELSIAMCSTMERALFAGLRPHCFNDSERAEGYDAEHREHMTRWLMVHRKDVAGVHVLLRSKMVAMGISVANLVLGGLVQPYTDRGLFEQRIDEALRAAKP